MEAKLKALLGEHAFAIAALQYQLDQANAEVASLKAAATATALAAANAAAAAVPVPPEVALEDATVPAASPAPAAPVAPKPAGPTIPVTHPKV
jgi:hypothetical protein